MQEYLVSLTAEEDTPTPTEQIEILHDCLEVAGGERINTSVIGWQRGGYTFKMWLYATSPEEALSTAIEIVDKVVTVPNLIICDWRITKCQPAS